MQEDFFDGWDKYPHRNSKPMSLERLVECILDLERNDVIAFETFKKMSLSDIQKEYFGLAHPTQMRKAIIKIEDLKSGNTGSSTLTFTTTTVEDGKVKIEQKTSFF